MELEIQPKAPVDKYEDAVQLLKLLQGDFCYARTALQDLIIRFSERETLAGEQLHTISHEIEDMQRSGTIRNVDPRPGSAGGHPSRRALSKAQAPPQYAPVLEVYCLGSFQARVDREATAQWRSTKARSLLQYMIARRGHPISRELMMEALWPGCDPLLGNNNLKAAASALRHTLASVQGKQDSFCWILFQDGNYVINPNAHLWCDVDQFEYHWNAGRYLENEGKVAEALREYETAEALYQGDYLEDSLYEEWTILRREALKDIYLAILSRLGDYTMQKSHYDSCILYCQKMLHNDRCREDAYQRLMVCYTRLGQRNRAMSWYRICEKTIKAELDVEPAPDTTLIYRKILHNERL